MSGEWALKWTAWTAMALMLTACGKNLVMGDCDADRDCASGQHCEDGFCVAEDEDDDGANGNDGDECVDGKERCDGECVDTSTSYEHCGGCGHICSPPAESCVEGICEEALSCPGTQTPCGGECVDLMSDENNCGTCGIRCDDGEVCDDGQCLMELVSACDPQRSPFGGGDGSDDDPYTICTADHLRAVDDHLDASFVLADDIDLAGESFEGLAQYTGPFGEWEGVFEGHFDGSGFEIANMTLELGDDNAVGLFGVNDGGVITDVAVEQVEVVGDRYVGALVGINEGDISGSSVDGTVQGSSNVGGVVGTNGSEASVYSSMTGRVVGTEVVGGVVGENLGVIDSWSDVDVEGEDRVGGLVGDNRGGGPCEIANSIAMGSVDGVGVDEGGWQSEPPEMVGGLVGRHHIGCLIEDSLAEGDVTADQTEAVGGLVGWARPESQIVNSEASGDVTGADFTGGLAGRVSSVMGEDWSEDDRPVVKASATGDVVGGDSTGGLVGRLEGTIEDSVATGGVVGGDMTGGLVGHVRETDWGTHGDVFDSRVDAPGAVEGTNEVGGLVGRNDGRIIGCRAEVPVSGSFRVGGLVGEHRDEIEASFASGDVENIGNSSGGLVGRVASGGQVVDAYALGDVVGQFGTGGLVGSMVQQGGGIGGGGETGEVMTSYSTGEVERGGPDDEPGMTPDSGLGGLVGYNEGDADDNVVDSYWNADISEIDSSEGGEPVADDDFDDEDSFTGFEFGGIWEMGSQRPRLEWE